MASSLKKFHVDDLTNEQSRDASVTSVTTGRIGFPKLEPYRAVKLSTF